MELKGWKARMVLAAAIITVVNVVITILLFIALGFMH